MDPNDPHPTSAPISQRGVHDLLDDLSAGRVSSADTVATLLERIAAVDAPGSGVSLRSILSLCADAEHEARSRDADRHDGVHRGPLHGVPVLVKDNIEAVGLPGTAGSLALADRTVTSDSPVAARLRGAGAVIVGSTNLSEWANFRSSSSISGWSAVGGLTGNPWALDRSAGGSSSGSGAAVAAGLAPVAIGTETNGSITCPAALNGVVGIKPTVGSVPTAGVVPISASQDVPGPLARSARDAALVLEVISGRGGLVDACRPDAARSLRVGVASGWMTGDAATDAVFMGAVGILEPLVAALRDVTAPGPDMAVYEDQTDVLIGELLDDLDAYLGGRPGDGVHSLADVVAFNERHRADELAHFGQDYFDRALVSGGRAAQAYQDARRRNVDWARDTCMGPALAEGVDVIIAPAYRPAWKSDLTHGDVLSGGGTVCTPPAILGWPILTLPMGLVDGLPVGLSIVGPAGSEARLVALGHALEQALGLSGSGALLPRWRPPQRG